MVINDRDRMKRTALHYAAVDGEPDRVTELIEAGADVNAREARDWTPLHFAAQSCEPEIAAQLIEAGAAVDAVTDSGWTPPFILIGVGGSERSDEVAAVLLAHGANPEHPGARGLTPLARLRQVSNVNYPFRAAFADLFVVTGTTERFAARASIY